MRLSDLWRQLVADWRAWRRNRGHQARLRRAAKRRRRTERLLRDRHYWD